MLTQKMLFDFIDELLNIDAFQDWGPNGLQIYGKKEIHKIALGVSASQALIDQAVSWGADALIVHHGLIWFKDPPVLKGFRRQRIKTVLCADLNLAAYHLPLDAHLSIGNNAMIARGLGLDHWEGFAKARGQYIGVLGALKEVQTIQVVIERLEKLFGKVHIDFLYGPEWIKRIAILSGGGASYFEEALEAGADLFITGEPSEPSMAIAQENHAHFIAAGHYRTETLGIQALGREIQKLWEVELRFFSIPNPV